ncbi:hypothetical protein ACFL51_01575 [Myxococcota bacterium]
MDVYRPQPLRPQRVRFLERPFGWVPFRLLSAGLLAELSNGAALLYFFLCLVADRQGLSYWGDARIEGVLGLCEAELERAREELCGRDLLAYGLGGLYQVLSLPSVGAEASANRRREAARGA